MMEKDAVFTRVKSIIDRLIGIVKCQKCFQLKEQDNVLFYRSCDHFFCSECLESQESCPICQTELGKPISIVNDKCMLALYQSLLKFELPSKNDIKQIYESCKKSKENLGEPEVEKTSKRKNKKAANAVDEIKNKENEKIDDTPNSNKESVKSSEEDASKRKKKQMHLNTILGESVSHPKITPKARPTGRGRKVSKSPKENEAEFPEVNVTPTRNSKLRDLNTSEPGSSKSTKSLTMANINKKNAKGETKLHLACKKGNLIRAKELLQAGADPNIHDHAGWTPLHESVYAGKVEVIKFLLENGSKINAPGPENTTALHEAIAHGKIEIVKVLMEYGADTNAMNILRETPLLMANKNNLLEMESILLSYKPRSIVKDVEREEPVEDNVFIYKHNLPPDHEKLVNKLADNFGLNLVTALTGKIQPTHIVVANDRFDITWGFLLQVLNGCCLVSIDWVKESMERKKVMPVATYQLAGDRFSGFTRARENKKNMLPGLFCGCHFFFGGNVKSYNVKNITVGLEDLQRTIEKNGGKIVKRCPDPESPSLEKTIPYHADPAGPLKLTAYYIIYQTGRWLPPIRYGMAHIKSLPVEWLFASIFRFQLIDPTNCPDAETLL